MAKCRQDKTTPSAGGAGGGGQERFHQHLGLSVSWGEGALTAGLSTKETMPPVTERKNQGRDGFSETQQIWFWT